MLQKQCPHTKDQKPSIGFPWSVLKLNEFDAKILKFLTPFYSHKLATPRAITNQALATKQTPAVYDFPQLSLDRPIPGIGGHVRLKGAAIFFVFTLQVSKIALWPPKFFYSLFGPF